MLHFSVIDSLYYLFIIYPWFSNLYTLSVVDFLCFYSMFWQIFVIILFFLFYISFSFCLLVMYFFVFLMFKMSFFSCSWYPLFAFLNSIILIIGIRSSSNLDNSSTLYGHFRDLNPYVSVSWCYNFPRNWSEMNN